jgi:hypothetical protein
VDGGLGRESETIASATIVAVTSSTPNLAPPPAIGLDVCTADAPRRELADGRRG